MAVIDITATLRCLQIAAPVILITRTRDLDHGSQRPILRP
jgi:hypothetical protein